MKFEDKIQLAVEMANFRIDISSSTAGLLNERLPARTKDNTERPADTYSDYVRDMFSLINELEASLNQSSDATKS